MQKPFGLSSPLQSLGDDHSHVRATHLKRHPTGRFSKLFAVHVSGFFSCFPLTYNPLIGVYELETCNISWWYRQRMFSSPKWDDLALRWTRIEAWLECAPDTNIVQIGEPCILIDSAPDHTAGCSTRKLTCKMKSA